MVTYGNVRIMQVRSVVCEQPCVMLPEFTKAYRNRVKASNTTLVTSLFINENNNGYLHVISTTR